MWKLLVLFLFFLSILEVSGQNHTIYGIVKDSLSGETLVGVNVYIEETKQGVTTNAYGFYSISLPEKSYTLSFSYLGYRHVGFKTTLQANLQQNILLSPIHKELSEVKVTAQKLNIQHGLTSKTGLAIERIKSIPAAMGEPDVLKSLQMVPGIQSVNEGATNLYIRGGSYDQNLILLDEAPVYNPAHSLGFFSTFNTDAIKNVSVYKGAFPSQYGGRLSSVVEISMREGNYKQTQLNAGIGLIASRLSIEGPIVNEKVSYIISGRYSYAGQTLNTIGSFGSDVLNMHSLRNFNDQNEIWFYDLNAKINYKVNQKNHLYFSSYMGHDKFYCFALNNNNELDWGNATATMRWNHIFSGKLFSNYTFYYSNYNYQYAIREDIRNFLWKSNIKELGFKADLSYFFNDKNTIKWGVNGIYHFFAPGSIAPKDSLSIIVPYSLDNKQSYEIAGYVGNDQIINSWLSLNYGLRYSVFLNVGPGTVYSYNSDGNAVTDSTLFDAGNIVNSYDGLEPRISMRLKVDNNNAIKIAYAHTTQYLHLLSNSTVGLPTDNWLPPDNYIKPQSSNQYILGYYRTLDMKSLEFSAESYYKTLANIIDYKDNANMFMNKHIETQLLSGTGYGYGLELLLEKKTGKFTGWVGYTYAKTQYKIDGINKNQYYSPRFDIRHNFTTTGSYELSKSLSVACTFKLASGGFLTIPDQIFSVDGAAFFDYSARNNYKLPAYHRLDVSATYKNPKNENRRYKSQWVLSVYNVYNNKNIYSLNVEQNSGDFTSTSASMMYLYGFLPTITYNLKF